MEGRSDVLGVATARGTTCIDTGAFLLGRTTPALIEAEVARDRCKATKIKAQKASMM